MSARNCPCLQARWRKIFQVWQSRADCEVGRPCIRYPRCHRGIAGCQIRLQASENEAAAAHCPDPWPGAPTARSPLGSLRTAIPSEGGCCRVRGCNWHFPDRSDEKLKTGPAELLLKMAVDRVKNSGQRRCRKPARVLRRRPMSGSYNPI